MHSDTQAFLSGLFRQMSGQAAFLTLSAIHPDGAHLTPSRHVRLDDGAALNRAIDCLMRANTLGWGAYVGIAPRQGDLGRWRRGRKCELAGLPALYIDVDQPDVALNKLATFKLPPSCIVQSSEHKFHLYWFLTTPTRLFNSADSILRGLAEYFGGDKVITAAQSMRLPGTINCKRGRQAARCHLISIEPDLRYDLAAFSAYKAVTQQSPVRPAAHRSDSTIGLSLKSARRLSEAVEDRLITQYGGFPRKNGWLAALCPFPHAHDKPGMHFGFSPNYQCGYCFGRHGKITLRELCNCLGVADNA